MGTRIDGRDEGKREWERNGRRADRKEGIERKTGDEKREAILDSSSCKKTGDAHVYNAILNSFIERALISKPKSDKNRL